MSHDGLIITEFGEDRHGVYEFRKARALVSHLQRMADVVASSESVHRCSKAPERPWLSLQEWTENSGQRRGQWQSDLEVKRLP